LETDREPLLPKNNSPEDKVAEGAEHVISPDELNRPPLIKSTLPLTQLKEPQVNVWPSTVSVGAALVEPKEMEWTETADEIVICAFVAKITSEDADGTMPPTHADESPQLTFPVERRVMVAEDTNEIERRNEKNTSAYDRERIAQTKIEFCGKRFDSAIYGSQKQTETKNTHTRTLSVQCTRD